MALRSSFSRRLILGATWLISSLVARAAEGEVSFMRDLAPLLVKRCISCHGDRKDSGNLRLHTFEQLMRGGAAGDVVVPGKPDESELLRLLATDDGSEVGEKDVTTSDHREVRRAACT